MSKSNIQLGIQQFAFMQTYANGDLTAFKKYISEGFDIRNNNDNPIKLAVIKGHLNIIQYINESNPNIIIENKDIIFEQCITDKQSDIIDYLLSINLLPELSENTLYKLARTGNLDVLKKLQTIMGDDIKPGTYTLLLQGACMYSQLNIAKYLTPDDLFTNPKHMKLSNKLLEDTLRTSSLKIVHYFIQLNANTTQILKKTKNSDLAEIKEMIFLHKEHQLIHNSIKDIPKVKKNKCFRV